jgi:phosphoglycolate phosphatase
VTYSAVIFDLDGTLADTLVTIGSALNQGLLAVGRPQLSLDAVARIVGEGVETLCRRALGESDEPLVKKLVAATRASYAANPMVDCRLYPGIRDMLAELRSDDVRLAVLSNKPHDLTLATLDGLDVTSCFELALGHSEAFPRKPDPTSAHHLVERLGRGAAETLYVGDTPIDIQTAHAAKLTVAAVTWGFRSEQELSEWSPHHLVRHPTEIVQLCRRP